MFFADFKATELSALAATLKIAGRSKMKKSELFDAIAEVINAAHVEALEEQDTRDIVSKHSASPADEWTAEDDAEMWAARNLTLTTTALPLVINGPRLPRKLKKSLRKRGLI